MHVRDRGFGVCGSFEQDIRDPTVGHELRVHRHLNGADVAVGAEDLA